MPRAKLEVIATVRGAHCEGALLKDLCASGASIFRINGSHVTPDVAQAMITSIKRILGDRAKMLIDLPGNKVRFILKKPLHLKKNKTFCLTRENFTFPEFADHLNKNQLLLANDSMLQFSYVSAHKGQMTFKAHIDGVLKSGKGINIYGKYPPLPFLHERDLALAEIAFRNQIDYLGFSYVRSQQDVIHGKELVRGTKAKPIFKIETSEACRHLEGIIPMTDTILIDRGDLSSEVGIHEVPYAIKRIVEIARVLKKRIFVATQFLHYMVDHPIPSISEIVALHDALSYADGIQLSEETAVGEYPVRAVEVIKEALRVVRMRKAT